MSNELQTAFNLGFRAAGGGCYLPPSAEALFQSWLRDGASHAGREREEEIPAAPSSPTADSAQIRQEPNYIRNVLANNLERCADILWDLKNKPIFDKSDGQVLGVIAVCQQIQVSLTALMVDIDNAHAQPRQEPVAWIVRWSTKHTPENASAYLNEKDAQRAAANVKMYADASDVMVIPTFVEAPAAPSSPAADSAQPRQEPVADGADFIVNFKGQQLRLKLTSYSESAGRGEVSLVSSTISWTEV